MLLLFKVSKVKSAFFGSSGASLLNLFKITNMHIPTMVSGTVEEEERGLCFEEANTQDSFAIQVLLVLAWIVYNLS